MIYSRIIGTGSYFPSNVLTNQDLMKMVDTSDEWIVTRTGIKTRHISDKEEACSEMAYKSTLEAMDMAGVKPSEIDGIIFPTITPDSIMPCAATSLQKRLGISGCFAFDLNTACSGFLYAMNLADALIKTGQYKTILLAGAERLSTMVDYTDRNTCILFGDGAGSAILRADTEPGILSFNMGADGENGDLLTMHGMGSDFLAHRDILDIEKELIKMQGSDVFKLAVRAMSDAAVQAVETSGLAPSELDWMVPHQANIRIIEATAKRFDLDMEKVIINLDRRGNTSSATIPTALDEGIRSGRIKSGDNVVFAAFGGGMSWGAAVAKM